MKIGSFLDVDSTGTYNTLGILSNPFGCAAGGTNTRNAQHCQRGLKLDLTALVSIVSQKQYKGKLACYNIQGYLVLRFFIG